MVGGNPGKRGIVLLVISQPRQKSVPPRIGGLQGFR